MHKGQKWRVGAQLLVAPYSPVKVLQYRRRRNGIREYLVAPMPALAAANLAADESATRWVHESRLRDQPA